MHTLLKKHINPYRQRKSRNLFNACIVLITLQLLVSVVTHIALTTWMHPFNSSNQFMEGYGTLLSVSPNNEETYIFDDILHVVTSRFMQDQPQLIALGKARLRLFETFCLPTMLNQKVNNFIWFVMVDPLLDSELLNELQSILEPHQNFFLVASNSKLLTPANLTTALVAGNSSTREAQQLLLTGDLQLLHSQMFDGNKPLLLETRLDADDGLHTDTLLHIQQIARALPVDQRGWQIICSKIHYEWRNSEIVEIAGNRTVVESSGTLRIVQESICVTPGYTLVRHRGLSSIDFPPWPKLGHNLVAREWPECRLPDESNLFNREEMHSGNATYDCWTKMGYFPSAIRSRTITSAGMSRVAMRPGDMGKYTNRTKMLWKLVERDFDISPTNAINISQYIKDNLESIVLDNLRGQCTFGHSCKNSSRFQLEDILSEIEKSKL